MSITETRPIAVNLALLMEEIIAWDAARPTPQLQPVPIPGDPLGASQAAFKLWGDAASTTIELPDTFSDLPGLTAVIQAHVKTNKSAGQQKRIDDAALRVSIKTKFQGLGFTNAELRWLDERWGGD